MKLQRALSCALLLIAVGLAGCSDDGGAAPDDEAFEGIEVSASEDTGVIRGVAIDDAIKPIADATIVLEGTEMETRTNENGAFAFSDLEPRTYFVTASKVGFKDVQQSVDVEAGVVEPPAVKLLMAADPDSIPYYQELTFEGFIECSATAVAVGYAACSGIGNDKFLEVHELDGTPMYVQSELVWDSTQALGSELSLMYSWDCGGQFLCDHQETGPSPVLLQANQTVIDEIGLGAENPLMLRVFNAGLGETREGVPGGGVGATYQQPFTVFTHVFYSYEPDEDWRFTVDGAPAAPS